MSKESYFSFINFFAKLFARVLWTLASGFSEGTLLQMHEKRESSSYCTLNQRRAVLSRNCSVCYWRHRFQWRRRDTVMQRLFFFFFYHDIVILEGIAQNWIWLLFLFTSTPLFLKTHYLIWILWLQDRQAYVDWVRLSTVPGSVLDFDVSTSRPATCPKPSKVERET